MGYKASTNIMLFILLMSLTVSFGDVVGFWDGMGVRMNVGVQSSINDAKDAFQDITAGGLGLESVIGLALFVFNALSAAYNLVTAAPNVIGHVIGGAIGKFIEINMEALFVILAGRDLLAASSRRDI